MVRHDCGGEIGSADRYNRELCRVKGLSCMGTAQIVMPENYIAMFGVPQADEARRIVAKAEPDIDRAIAALREVFPSRRPGTTLYDRLMSGPVNPVFYRFFVKADAFRATDACIGCGKCVELCPLNNIHLENGKPVWAKTAPTAWRASAIAPKRPSSTAKRAGESHGITLKRWKGSSRTCEGERKLDEVFILTWIRTKTRQLG